MKALATAALIGLVSLQAMAEDTPHHDCKQPTIPQVQASDSVRHFFEKRSNNYKSCISKFVDEQKAIYTNTTDPVIAKQSHEAAEAAIKEFNDFQDKLRNSVFIGALRCRIF